MKSFFIPIAGSFLVFSILLSCDTEPTKDAKAEALYDRICAVIHSSDSYTEEWKNIKNRIMEDKDTVFMVNSADFQILVRKTISLKDIITDTAKVAPVSDPARPAPDSSKKESDGN